MSAADLLDFYDRHIPFKQLCHYATDTGTAESGLLVACYGQERRSKRYRYVYATIGFCRYGFELLFHLESEDDAFGEDRAPAWPVEVLDNLLSYVHRTGLAFRAGDHSRYDHFPCEPLAGLLYLPSQTVPPELRLHLGTVYLLDALPVTEGELDLARCWTSDGVGRVLREAGLLPYAQRGRTCLTKNPEQDGWRTYLEAMADEEGSGVGVLPVRGSLQVGASLAVRCAIHPDYANEVRLGLKRRLQSGRSLALECYPRGAGRRDFALCFAPTQEGGEEKLSWDVERRILQITCPQLKMAVVGERLLRSLEGPPQSVPLGRGSLTLSWAPE